MDLNRIRRECSHEWAREQAIYWWRRYYRTTKMIAHLRKQNRRLRVMLSDKFLK